LRWAERSISDELVRETDSSITPVVRISSDRFICPWSSFAYQIVSYIVMFVYVAISLGKLSAVRSKILLGFTGACVVTRQICVSTDGLQVCWWCCARS
jgi:hypothetical protein